MKTTIYTTEQREQIISSMQNVQHDSIAGYSIRLFAKTARVKADKDIVDALNNIGNQITDNPRTMMRVLGNQWDFLKNMAFKASKIQRQCISVTM
jgi:hypothetical protein